MKRSIGLLLGAGALLLLSTPTGAQPPAALAPAPRGFDATRDTIEHGKVEAVEYDSKSAGTRRRMVVYTPPGYSKDARYPVLYLLHGAGDNETGWQRRGLAPTILDNLYADKKLAPMIVVMPNGSMQPPGAAGGFSLGPVLAGAILRRADANKDGKVTEEEFVAAARQLFNECDRDKKGTLDEKQLADGLNRALASGGLGRPGAGAGARGRGGFITAFENDLLKDIIPYVEAHYPVRADAEHRAVAGLSMGGGQALTIGLRHLDTFAWVGGFSSAIFGNANDLVPSGSDARTKLRLLWLSCGDRDSLMDRSKSFHTALEEKQVPHVWQVDSGAHEWPVWKNDLYLLAPLLFQQPGATPRAAGQAPRRQAGPADVLVSPEIGSDRKVTFRIRAPKASEVTVGGDWAASGPVKLEKDDKGVWSATVGPLTPDFYSYTFMVDGVRTVDPRNPTIKQGIASLDSMFFVPGEESAFEDNQKVPHGDIRLAWYQSSTLGTQRRMHVYTPPGYDGGTDRYPVLYLLHGGGDDDSGWSTVGRAGFILDNLLAEKKAKPMLIVMPNGSLPRPANMPRFTPGTTPSPEVAAALAALQERFTNELLKDVIPYVEKNYRVQAGAGNRALAGLSMGGGQTLRAVTSHPDEFAYVGVWSAGIGRDPADFEKRNATFLDSADKVNKSVKLFSISVGDKDQLAAAGSRSLSELLDKHGIKNELHVSGGGHTWINWRHYLNEFAPRLFQ
jgi:enterochelin esterase family protein